MEQKVLILYYSQAGQTHRAVELFKKGLLQSALTANRNFSGAASDHRAQNEQNHSFVCDVESFSVEPNFPFPWSPTGFFAAFPRCHVGPLPKVVLPQIDWSKYDRVVLGYQVWFLAPSLPLQAFLNSPEAQNLRGKSVLSLVTCRNLWQSASRYVQAHLSALGAFSLGQITICERSPLWASFVTTPRWMLTGKKNAFAFFPAAGISDVEFEGFENRAKELGARWLKDPSASGAPVFESNLNRVSLMLMDRVGNRFFKIWSAILQCVAPGAGTWQNLWLILFRLTLITLILIAGPCTKIIELLVGNDPRYFDRPTPKPSPSADII